jgi:hypothetical protein
MSAQQFIQFFISRFLEYWKCFFLTLFFPAKCFRPLSEFTAQQLDGISRRKVVGPWRQSHQVQFSVVFIVANLLLGKALIALTPNRSAEAPQATPLVLMTLGAWLVCASLIFVCFRLWGSKVSYWKTVSVVLQVVAVLFVVSHLAALFLSRTPSVYNQLSASDEKWKLFAFAPTIAGILMHTTLTILYLPLALWHVHKLGWWRQLLTFLSALMILIAFIATLKKKPASISVIEDANINLITFSKIDKAWRYSQGEGVKIAICDWLFDIASLKAEKYVDPASMIPGEHIGYNQPGHGEWMAEIIHQVAPKAKIIPIRTCPTGNVEFEPYLCQGIRYAADHGAVAVTSSMGYIRYSRELREAVEYAEQKGTIFINCHPVKGLWTKSAKELNTKIIHTGLVSVPGHPTSPESGRDLYVWPYSITLTYRDGWGYSNGPPIVAGVIALMKSTQPMLSPKDIRQILMSTGSSKLGFRVLDAEAAVLVARRK